MPVDAYTVKDGAVVPLIGPLDAAALGAAVWIDIRQPSDEERFSLRELLGVDIPAGSANPQSRLGRAMRLGNATPFMSTSVIADSDAASPTLRQMAFAVIVDRLITFTYAADCNLRGFLGRLPALEASPALKILVGLLNGAGERCGDALDQVSSELERINRLTFQHAAAPSRRLRFAASPRLRNRQLERVLELLGGADEALVKISRSILTLRRLVETAKGIYGGDAMQALERKLKMLDEAENDLSGTAAFMLQGAVGFIGIQQSQTMNTLTVIGVLLTPPVVVASVYGMNFDVMPELRWALGYPWALGLMVLSAAGMYGAARFKGWI